MGTEIMLEEPNWAKILRAVHDGEETKINKVTRYEELEDRGIQLDREEIDNALDYLDDANLMDELGGDAYQLKPRGFDVAHQRKITEQQARREKQQNRTNQAIGYLTLGLVLINAVAVAQQAAVVGLETTIELGPSLLNWPNFWSAIGFIIVMVMALVVHEADLI